MVFQGTRKQAKEAGASHYWTGTPCKNGHTVERRTSSGHCVECVFPSQAKQTERAYNWWKNNRERYEIIRYRYRYGLELSEIRPKPKSCEVCGLPNKKIVLDHCHGTGQFRGWLCDPCNRVLGSVKDSPERLRKLADYLEAHGGRRATGLGDLLPNLQRDNGSDQCPS